VWTLPHKEERDKMIIAREKPFEEILSMIEGFKSLLIVGCAGCTAICLAGGQREVDRLKNEIKLMRKKINNPIQLQGYTVERQCESYFLSDLDNISAKFDAILSLGCGAGVQFIAEHYPEKIVLPALNTLFIGVNRDIGLYEENCRSCGDCKLAYTGGICPVTRCAKSIFNGPCGGSKNGMCEVDNSVPCAWCEIYERLKSQNRLHLMYKIHPSVQWKNQKAGFLIQKGFEKKYSHENS